MGFIHLVRLLIFFMTVASLHGADEKSTVDDKHVIIGPVENITAYLNGSTNLVIRWDNPPVYIIHDVANATFDEVTDQTEMVVSKHPNSAAVNSSSELINSTDVVSSVAPDIVGDSDSNIQQTGTSATTVWKCRTAIYFRNYTIAMKDQLDIGDPSMVLTFQSILHDLQLRKVTVKENQKIVLFSEGCISSFEVLWKRVEPESQVFNISLPPTASTANITGLEPGAQYEVTIKAIYVSGDSFVSTRAIFTTKSKDDQKGCACDMYGAISPSRGCNFSAPSYCSCKQGYEGSFCELCSPGYYRTAPHFPCHRCPCDVHATRMSTCQFEEGFLRCDSCELGYIGNTCHTCDRGYYRLNRHCVSCFCNGNTSPNAHNMCRATTGVCISCQYNTTGFNCERCQLGYIGDPITFKNCTHEDDVKSRSLTMGSSSVSPGMIAAIVITFLLLVVLVVAVLLFRRYHSRERLRAFWTIEMKRDRDDVDFSSVHNDDARLDDTGDVDYFSKHGVSATSGKYSRLQEDM